MTACESRTRSRRPSRGPRHDARGRDGIRWKDRPAGRRVVRIDHVQEWALCAHCSTEVLARALRPSGALLRGRSTPRRAGAGQRLTRASARRSRASARRSRRAASAARSLQSRRRQDVRCRARALHPAGACSGGRSRPSRPRGARTSSSTKRCSSTSPSSAPHCATKASSRRHGVDTRTLGSVTCSTARAVIVSVMSVET